MSVNVADNKDDWQCAYNYGYHGEK